MHTTTTAALFLGCPILCVALSTVAGCSDVDGPAPPTVSTPPPATLDPHDHPTEGPHGGGLIELGNEEYHAELVHDEATGRVTIYLLDSAAKSAAMTEAAELKVNLSHEGQAEQFVLFSNPQAGDALGTASRFDSTDPELAEELDHEGVKAQLVVMVGGKQFRGEIHHEHDGHEGH